MPSSALPAVALVDSSYRNFKEIGLAPQPLPAIAGDARGHADFDGDGGLDLFTATLTYSPTAPPPATPSRFSIWVKQFGTFVQDANLLASTDGCIHPRKALVADFNQDGRADVFVACHGFDAPPFPGERNKVVLSQGNGSYVIHDASTDVGFFHAAASADLNGDGFPDVVVVNNFDPARAFVLLNRRDGTFEREAPQRLPPLTGNYFTIELADVDEDGMLDLLLGGHEWEQAPTRIYINPGTNVFTSVAPITIPASTTDGVVLDFVLTGSGTGRTLWVLRTSGGDGTFYASRVLQRVLLQGLASSVVLNERPGQWVPWAIPARVGGIPVIASDDGTEGLVVPQ